MNDHEINQVAMGPQEGRANAPFDAERAERAVTELLLALGDLWDALVQPFVDRGVVPKLYWVSVSPEARKVRLLGRAADRDREKLENIDEYLSQNPTVPPVVTYVAIDGEKNFSIQLKDND